MKIGLLTYFRIDVAGQYFQALATIDNLKRVFPGSEVELVNIVHEKKRGFRPSKNPRYFVPSILRHLAYKSARDRVFTPILSGPLLLDNSYTSVEKHLAELDHDVFVVGADTCLKVDHHYKSSVPFFWLSPKLRRKKLMLSGSAEYTDFSDLDATQKDMIKASVDGFSFLGVRDRMTSKLVRDVAGAGGPPLLEMPDPTIPWQITTNGLKSLEKLKRTTGKKLCGVNLAQTAFCAELLRKLSGEFHFVSINTPTWPGGSRLASGPVEWLDMFGSLDLMLTSSFHETIFSLKTGVPVVAFDSSATRFHRVTGLSKARCLLEAMDMTRFHVNPFIDGSVPTALDKIGAAVHAFPHDDVKSKLDELSESYWQALALAKESIAPKDR
jgi:hypothetical protein